MAWQTPEIIENDAKLNVVQLEKDQRNQYHNGKKVFAVAPMIDCTHHF